MGSLPCKLSPLVKRLPWVVSVARSHLALCPAGRDGTAAQAGHPGGRGTCQGGGCVLGRWLAAGHELPSCWGCTVQLSHPAFGAPGGSAPNTNPATSRLPAAVQLIRAACRLPACWLGCWPQPASEIEHQCATFLHPFVQEETCYIQVTGMVTADVLENDQEYDDVSWEGCCPACPAAPQGDECRVAALDALVKGQGQCYAGSGAGRHPQGGQHTQCCWRQHQNNDWCCMIGFRRTTEP